MSEFETLDALRDRVRTDLQHDAEHESEHKLRHDLLRSLAGRIRTAPAVLVDREIDRRLEEFVRRLMDQGVDPMKAGIDWQEFRDRQRPAAEDTVRARWCWTRSRGGNTIEATDEDLETGDRQVRRAIGPDADGGPGPAREGRQALDRIRAGIQPREDDGVAAREGERHDG